MTFTKIDSEALTCYCNTSLSLWLVFLLDANRSDFFHRAAPSVKQDLTDRPFQKTIRCDNLINYYHKPCASRCHTIRRALNPAPQRIKSIAGFPIGISGQKIPDSVCPNYL